MYSPSLAHRSASPRPGSRSGSLAAVEQRGGGGTGHRAGTPTNFALGKKDRAIQQLVQEESAALNFLARRGSEAERDSADSEGFVTDDDHAMANAERELAEDAEWKRIQQNTFTRWANEHLKQADKTISDLETDLSDGLKLISLIEVLSGKRMPRHNKKPNFRSQKLENVTIAFDFLEREGVTLVNIDSTDIVDCKLKLILGLIWTLILHYAISMPMWDGPPLGSDPNVPDKTPKQRLMDWVKDKMPDCPVNNFTSDWKDGKAVGALVDSVAPGLCPDWENWDPETPVENAAEAMDLADKWLNVPKLLTPEEIVNPNVDEQSMMTYLSQFPNAKLKPGAPLRQKVNEQKVRAYGPGLEPTGVVANAPANFTVETFGAGDGDLAVDVTGPDGSKVPCETIFNNDRKLTYSCSYLPESEGDYVVKITFSRKPIPKSPYHVRVEGFAGDAAKVTAAGPGLEPEGVVVNKPTWFEIFAEGAGKGNPDVIVLDPKTKKDSVPISITPTDDNPDTYRCEYVATLVGLHSVNVFFAGNPIPTSPFGVKVSPASIPSKVRASGRGLQPVGIRVNETVDFRVFTEGAGEGDVGVKIIGPGGVDVPMICKKVDEFITEYTYTPRKEGRHTILITFAGQEIKRSPFNVKIGPHKNSKIKAYGPGLKGGIVNKPARFTVDTCGETGALGFQIEGPSQAKINCLDNGDGSADVDYIPTAEGEYAVHILCDKEDIPGSPYMAQILPPTDYDPDKVKAFGPGLENGVNPKEVTHFTVDTTEAGDAPLEIEIIDQPDSQDVKELDDGGGVYKCSYKPKTGAPKQTVLINYGGVAVPGSPFHVLNDNPNEPGLVKLYGPGVEQGQVRAKKPVEFTVDCTESGTGDLKIKISSSKRKSVPVTVLDNGDETFTVTYEAQDPGRQTINVTLDGNEVPQSPIVLNVAPAVDVTKIKLVDFEPEAYVDCINDFNVDIGALPKDLQKNLVTCDITGPDGSPVESLVLPHGENEDQGPFNVSYTPFNVGDHEIDLRYDGEPLPDSPYPVTVKSGCNPDKVKAHGDGLERGIVDEHNQFVIETRNAGTGGLGLAMEGPNEAVVQCQDNQDGSCTVDYVPTEEGDYDIAIKFSDEHIPGSPFKVPCFTRDGKRKPNANKVEAYGPGLDPGAVLPGKPTQFTVDASKTGEAPVKVEIETEDGKVPSRSIKPNGDGTHEVTYVPPPVGEPYLIDVKYNGDPIPGSPFEMTSSPNLQDVVGDVTGKKSSAGSRKGSSDLLYGRNGTGVQRRPGADSPEDDDYGNDSRKNSGAHSRKGSEISSVGDSRRGSRMRSGSRSQQPAAEEVYNDEARRGSRLSRGNTNGSIYSKDNNDSRKASGVSRGGEGSSNDEGDDDDVFGGPGAGSRPGKKGSSSTSRRKGSDGQPENSSRKGSKDSWNPYRKNTSDSTSGGRTGGEDSRKSSRLGGKDDEWNPSPDDGVFDAQGRKVTAATIEELGSVPEGPLFDGQGRKISPNRLEDLLQDGGRISPGGSLYDNDGRPLDPSTLSGEEDGSSWNPYGKGSDAQGRKGSGDGPNSGRKISPGGTAFDSQGHKINPDGSLTDALGRKITPGGSAYDDKGRKISPDGFDALGRKVTDEQGHKINPDGSVTDALGRKITPGGSVIDEQGFKVNPDGSLTDALGRKITPGGSIYDDQGRKVNPSGSLTDAMGRKITPGGSAIDDQGRKVNPDGSLTDALGRKITPSGSIYDDQGRKVNPDGSLTDTMGRKITPGGSAIDDQGRKVNPDGSLTDALGRKITPSGSIYDDQGRKVNPDGSLIDTLGRKITPGGSVYDDQGGKLNPTDGKPSHQESWNPLDSDGKKISGTFDPQGRKITPGGSVYDNKGRKMNPDGSLTDALGRKITPGGSVYDGQGRKVNPDGSITDALGRNITPDGSVFDSQGRKISSKNSLADAQGRKITPGGSILDDHGHKINPDGSVTDALGRKITPGGSVYDDQGHIVNPDSSMIDALGRKITPGGSMYDDQGRKINPDGSFADGPGRKITPGGSVYDDQGRKINPDGSLTDTQGRKITPGGSVYDNYGQKVNPDGSMTDALGRKITPGGSVYDSQGNKISPDCALTDGLGRKITPGGTIYNDQGHIVNPDGSLTDASGRKITAGGSFVDDQGRKINPDGSVTDAIGRKTTPRGTHYNDQGEKVNPDGSPTGALGRKITPGGSVYDDQGRKISPSNTDRKPSHQDSWNPLDSDGKKLSGTDSHGRKITPGGSTYDPQGRKISPSNSEGPDGRKISPGILGRHDSQGIYPGDTESSGPGSYFGDSSDDLSRKGSGNLAGERRGSNMDSRKGSGLEDSWNPLRHGDDRKGSTDFDPFNRKGSQDNYGSRKTTGTDSQGHKTSPGGTAYDAQGRKTSPGGTVYDAQGRKISPSSMGRSPQHPDRKMGQQDGVGGFSPHGDIRKGSSGGDWNPYGDDSRKSSGAYDNYVDNYGNSRKGSRKDTGGSEGFRGPTQLRQPSESRKGSGLVGHDANGNLEKYPALLLPNIPLSATGGEIGADVRTPSGTVDHPEVRDNGNGSASVIYQPSEEGPHVLDIKQDGDHVQGSPYKFHASPLGDGKVHAYGGGLTHAVCGDPANFVISTKGAGAGGLSLAVEGPSKAEIECLDNKDGTVNVSFLPTAPGEYKIYAKFADEHIEGSPFTCKVTGEGTKRKTISVGATSDLSLPENLSEYDLRSLNAYIVSPSGIEEPCFLKKLPKGNHGISFTPREVGEHLVSVKRNGKHIRNSPFKVMVNPEDVGDATRVKVDGPTLKEGRTHEDNTFRVDTKNAGYGGLSLSVEGPSKAEIKCKDNEDGTLDVSYKPTQPGLYIVNLKFADQHIPGSPFAVAVSGEGSERVTENINRLREAVPITEVGSQCRLTFKMPGINCSDLRASVTAPTGQVESAMVAELEDGLYAVNFVPYELGIHTVSVMYRDVDIPGSPFQFTVGPLQDGGAHRVHAGGPGLERGIQGQPADFNVWTREAGHGSLAISVEGPSKAEVDFNDRKDGSCHVSYVVEEPGEYSVGIRFNEVHIPGSPYKVCILPSAEEAERVRLSNLSEGSPVCTGTPQTMLLNMNGAGGDVECKLVSPSGREDDCFITPLAHPGEHSVRFVPKEEGTHYLHAKLNGIHIPGSPFKLVVVDNLNNAGPRGGGGVGSVGIGGLDGAGGNPTDVSVHGSGIEGGVTGKPSHFIINTTDVGAGTLSITVDGPSKVDLACTEVDDGYEVSYTPMAPGKYFVTVKYNGNNVRGSPFTVRVQGDNLTGSNGYSSGGGAVQSSRRESKRSSVTMETMQRTSYVRHQYSERLNSTQANNAAAAEMRLRGNSGVQTLSYHHSRSVPIFDECDPSAVWVEGSGAETARVGRHNSFAVDCSRAGNNILYVGVYGPETPCEEVVIKHRGNQKYSVDYVVQERGSYIIFVKWGDHHVPGSPFHIDAN